MQFQDAAPGVFFGSGESGYREHYRRVVEVIEPSDPGVGEWWCMVYSVRTPRGEKLSISETEMSAFLTPLTADEAAERKADLLRE
jgi:hypothetical protein